MRFIYSQNRLLHYVLVAFGVYLVFVVVSHVFFYLSFALAHFYPALGENHDPCYPGIHMEVDHGGVVRVVYVGGSHGEPKSFFVLVDETPKRIVDIDRDDIRKLGFEATSRDRSKDLVGWRTGDEYVLASDADRSSYYNVFYFRDPTKNAYKLEREMNQSNYLSFTSKSRIQFSSRPEGPFLKLPCDSKEVFKLFGKPSKWSNHRSRAP